MNIKNLLYNKLDHLRFKLICSQFNPVEMCADIGCGDNPQTIVPVKDIHFLVDPNLSDEWHGITYVPVKETWEEFLKWVRHAHGKPDCYTLIDVIEHLPKDEGVALLKQTMTLAKQIVVFTPLGFMEQNDPDNQWNTHRSGWNPSDFGDGWKVYVFLYFHWCDFKGKTLEKPHGAILAVYTRFV